MAIKDKIILIIDDDPAIIKLLTKIFEAQGVHAISAQNLKEAKHIFTHTIPHLIFLDIKLENENGLEYLAFIKSISLGESLPIIIFSSIDNKKVEQFTLANGAVDYIRKPIIASTIIQKTRKYLKESNAPSSFYVFQDYLKFPQKFKIQGNIKQFNYTHVEVETTVKIAGNTNVSMTSSLCEKIKFENPQFRGGDYVRTIDLGHYVNKLYYVGANDIIIQNIKNGKFS